MYIKGIQALMMSALKDTIIYPFTLVMFHLNGFDIGVGYYYLIYWVYRIYRYAYSLLNKHQMLYKYRFPDASRLIKINMHLSSTFLRWIISIISSTFKKADGSW